MKTILTLITLFVSISFSLQAKVIYKLVDKQELPENKTISIHLTNFKNDVNEVKIDFNCVDSPKLVLFKRANSKITRDGNTGLNNRNGSKNLEMSQVNEILKNFNREKFDKKINIYQKEQEIKKPGLIYFGNALIKKGVYGSIPICIYPVPDYQRILNN